MAGPWYLRSSDGDNGDDGLSWANACATMSGVLAKAVAAGDIIYVDDDHQETLAADITWTFPGTEGTPNKVIVVITDTTTAVASYNCTNQKISGDTNDAHIIIAGEVYFWGICLDWGDGTYIISNSKTVTFEKSNLIMTATAAKYLGVFNDNSTLVLINSDIDFSSNAGHYIKLYSPSNFIWRGGSLTGDIDTLIKTYDEGPYIEIIGGDLSAMIGGDIITVAAVNERLRVNFEGIKLNATPPNFISAAPERASAAYLDIADSGNTVYKFRREFQYGYVMEETTLTVVGKALYDGMNPFAVKMVSRAAPTPTLYDPWRYHLATKRVTGLGSGKTFTVYILENGNGGQPAAWNDDDVWLEVIYPDDATAQFNIQSDRIVTPTTAPAAQTDDVGRWQNETNGREQKLEVTVANGAGKVGPCEFWICIAQANKTLYVCPEVIVS